MENNLSERFHPALETVYKESCCSQRKEGFKQNVLTDSTVEPTHDV